MLSVPYLDEHLDPTSPSSPRDSRTDAGLLFPPQSVQRKRARSAGPAFGLQPSPGQTPLVTIETVSQSSTIQTSESQERQRPLDRFHSPVGLRLDLKSANLTIIKNVGTRGQLRMVKHEPTGLIMIQKTYNHGDRDDLIRELRVLGSCASEHIVALLGSTELASRTGRVEVYMEFMDCGSMDMVLSAVGRIPVSMLAHVAKCIVGGLLYLSERLRMLHRDVRPGTMFLNSRGEVKLGGFGLSSHLEHQSSATRETSLKSLMYHSPERVAGSKASISGDIWSLGISLFEMATGKHPYGAFRSQKDLLDVVASGFVPDLPATANLTPQFRAMIFKCLVREEERPSLRRLSDEDEFLTTLGADSFDPQEWTTCLFSIKGSNVNRAVSLTEPRTKETPPRPRSLRPTSVRYDKNDTYLSHLSGRIEALSLSTKAPANATTSNICQGCSEAVSSTMTSASWNKGFILDGSAGQITSCPLCQRIRSWARDGTDSTPSPVIQRFWESSVEAAKAQTISGTPILVVDKLDGDMDRIFRAERAEETDRDTSSAPAFQVAAAWLRKCMLEHRHCHGKSNPSPTPLPKRVIDVGLADGSRPLRLYPGDGLSDAYFTLSYRWDTQGINTSSFMTTKANIRSYFFDIPKERLPQVMKDAIRITREFGVRYLWIDALCIVQDSHSDWESQAKEMAAIYKNSTLTIAAAGDTREGDGIGCFRPRPRRRVWPVYCGMKWPDGSPVYLFADGRAAGGGIRPRSVLDTRAWILQEQLLSRRTLTYSDRGLLFWDCVTISTSESFPCGIPTFHDADLRHSELRLFKRFILRERSHEGIDPNPASLAAAKRQLYRHWRRVVEDYSARILTYEGDKLMALAGVAKEVTGFVEDELMFGLWKGELWRELLWSVRDTSAMTVNDAFSSVTWTWAGLHGPISFDIGRGRAAADRLDACIVLRESIIRDYGGEHPEIGPNAGSHDENDFPNDGKSYGVLTVEGVMVPLLAPAHQPDQPPSLDVSLWRPDVAEIVEAEVTCLVVAASERVVYGIGLIPYPDSTNTYGRVGFVRWKGDVGNIGWDRAARKWRRRAKLEILHIM